MQRAVVGARSEGGAAFSVHDGHPCSSPAAPFPEALPLPSKTVTSLHAGGWRGPPGNGPPPQPWPLSSRQCWLGCSEWTLGAFVFWMNWQLWVVLSGQDEDLGDRQPRALDSSLRWGLLKQVRMGSGAVAGETDPREGGVMAGKGAGLRPPAQPLWSPAWPCRGVSWGPWSLWSTDPGPAGPGQLEFCISNKHLLKSMLPVHGLHSPEHASQLLGLDLHPHNLC